MSYNYEPHYAQASEDQSHLGKFNGVGFAAHLENIGAMSRLTQPLSTFISSDIVQRLNELEKSIDVLAEKLKPITKVLDTQGTMVSLSPNQIVLSDSDIRAKLCMVENKILEITNKISSMTNNLDTL